MEMFAANPTQYMDEFSREFEQGMMEIIRRKARSQRQNANQLYRDYIADKQHFHMNATIWETLTDFVMYLGRKGLCEVDETEKGWFVTYIDRDPETLARLEARAKRERNDLDSEEKHQREIQRQVKAARLAGEEDKPAVPTELQRGVESAKVQIKNLQHAAPGGLKSKMAASCGVFSDVDQLTSSAAGTTSKSSASGKKPMSAIEVLMLEEKAKKKRADAHQHAGVQEPIPQQAGRKDNWLFIGLVVKCVNKKLQGGVYYKQKGCIEELPGKYVAHVRMLNSGDLLQLDQADLETVIPTAGGKIIIVNGEARGQRGCLLSIDEGNFCVQVKLDDGRLLRAVEYEDVCKLA